VASPLRICVVFVYGWAQANLKCLRRFRLFSGCLLTRVSSLRPLFEKHPFFVLRIMRFTVALLSFGYASGARVHRVDDSPSGVW
jgi:hypothetical protein